MWSPKTPLRLPGKKLPLDDENDSEYFFGTNYHPYLGEAGDGEDDDDDENVVFSAESSNKSSKSVSTDKNH